MDALRGEHSTGLYAHPIDDKRHSSVLVKRACHAFDFLELGQVQTIFRNTDWYNFLLAHNRQATLGTVNRHNAHPHETDELVLVHNGTVNNIRGLPLKEDFSNDSMGIAHNLSSFTPQEVLPQLQGTYALVWMDFRTGLVHMARNSGRPLYFGTIEGEDTIVFGSEKYMLYAAADRNNLKFERMMSINPGHMFKFDLKDLKNPTTEEFTPWTAPATTYRTYPNNNNNNYGHTPRGGTDRRGPIVPRHKQQGKNIYDPLLKEFDLSATERYMFVPDSFVPYEASAKGSDMGEILGNIELGPGDSVEAFLPMCTKALFGNNKLFVVAPITPVTKIYNINGQIVDNQEIMVDVVAAYPEKERPELCRKYWTKKPEAPKDADKSTSTQTKTSHSDPINGPEPGNEDENAELSLDLTGNAGAIVRTVRGPNKRFIPLDEFDTLTKFGCGNCSCDIDEQDAEEIIWIHEASNPVPLCTGCAAALLDGLQVQH